ncbi:MAG: glucose-1-phosphate cytidylyltransferase [Planctomycetes bacterium]|nr:glucose-1-phosphate cytidylyltransferase [Planctomycetota bacterium]
MKVVLFCGGLGLRLREYNESVPKPMVPVGTRPILWHLMKYYAHYGHTDFILCLGWQAKVIKEFFLDCNEHVSNDFVLQKNGKVELLNNDIKDWTITFVDTGVNANIGQRLKAVEPYLEGEKVFLANYSDGLTDLPLPKLTEHFFEHDSVATCMAVKPNLSFHLIDADEDGLVERLTPMAESSLWMNAGFFVFSSEIFDYLGEGEELLLEPFERLTAKQKLRVYQYEGFWACMDTYKDKQILDGMCEEGEAPWMIWEKPGSARASSAIAEPSQAASVLKSASSTAQGNNPETVARKRPR